MPQSCNNYKWHMACSSTWWSVIFWQYKSKDIIVTETITLFFYCCFCNALYNACNHYLIWCAFIFLSSGLAASRTPLIGQLVGRSVKKVSKKCQKLSKTCQKLSKRGFKASKVCASVQIYFTGLWQAFLSLEAAINMRKVNQFIIYALIQ